MSRTHTFIALGSTAERIYDVLTKWLDAECVHSHHYACEDGTCCHDEAELTGLDEVAVTLAELIEKGELS